MTVTCPCQRQSSSRTRPPAGIVNCNNGWHLVNISQSSHRVSDLRHGQRSPVAMSSHVTCRTRFYTIGQISGQWEKFLDNKQDNRLGGPYDSRTMCKIVSHPSRRDGTVDQPPWDRPNSNRLMTPPIFDALLVITYTFSRYMLKMKNVYLPILFQNQVSPTLKIFIFCLFWTENQWRRCVLMMGTAFLD